MQGTPTQSSHLLKVVAASFALSCMLVGLVFTHITKTTYASDRAAVIPHGVDHPYYTYAGPAIKGTKFKCQSNTAAIRCYGPDQIHNAYNIQPVLNAGITGKGHTIVLIDAYQSPTIVHDLHLFDQLFNLPDPKLTIYKQPGLPPFNINDATQTGWASEITLDVEWSHAIAPGANIELVEARSGNDPDIYTATRYAVNQNLGDIISQSFGEAESCTDSTILKQEHQLFFRAALKGISIFASAGDSGAAQPTCNNKSYILSGSSPSDDPFVTSVGGTTLDADATTGQYKGETVWNEPSVQGAGGGGFSKIYRTPFYQYAVPGIDKFRGEPDVSYNAGVNDGVLAVFSSSGQGQNQVFVFGGTSAGSPQWAGIAALGSQMAHHSLGFLNPAFYAICHTGLYKYAFHDISSGNNSFSAPNSKGTIIKIEGFSAHSGWDAASGWGTPNVAHLLPLLANQPLPSPSLLSQLAN